MPVDPSWDVYALGLICCYLLSGLRPRRQWHEPQDYLDYRDQVFALLRHAATEGDAARQGVVEAVVQLLSRALDQDAHKRPTAAALAAALATLLEQMGVNLRLGRAPDKGQDNPLWRQFIPSQRWWLAGLAVGVLLLCFGWIGAWRNTAESQRLLGSVAQPPVVAALADPSGRATPPPNLADRQPVALPLEPPTPTRQVTAPPTLAALPTKVREAIPTLAPTLTRGVVALQQTPPTLAALPPTRTPTTAPPTPTAFPTATSARQRPPTPSAVTLVRLSAPPANTISAQERVDFVWSASGAPLAANHCYELVFWDPGNPQDKRSPTGAGRSAQGTVNFAKLREGPDPLLRSLTRRTEGFAWGVRLVACTAVRHVVQDVGEVRHFTYRP